MHMADALLAPAVAATMYAASATAAGVSIHRLRRDDEAQKLPVMAVTSALVFAGQMINYTIPGTGSSGHLCGGMLLSALLGPQAGFLSMIVILAIQCLFFADGGLMALGANVWNMAFYGCFVGYYLIWRPILRGRFGLSRRARVIAASLLGCVATLQLGAFSVVLETSLSGIVELPFGAFLALMQPIHLAIGLVEGAVTAAVLLFVYDARPALLRELDGAAEGKRSLRATPCWRVPTPTGWNGRCSATRRRATAPTWVWTRNASAWRAPRRRERRRFRRPRPSCRTTPSPTATAPRAPRCPGWSARRWWRWRRC